MSSEFTIDIFEPLQQYFELLGTTTINCQDYDAGKCSEGILKYLTYNFDAESPYKDNKEKQAQISENFRKAAKYFAFLLKSYDSRVSLNIIKGILYLGITNAFREDIFKRFFLKKTVVTN